MYFKQFYLGCLSHASYLIGSDGEAVVVDPQRDVEQYLDEAAANALKITHVLETHLHADFVSGHRELASRVGAEIVFGARAAAEFPHRAVHDGDEVQVGRVVLRALETPGHTPEGISWLVIDTEVSPEPVKVLTGDTLFIGDVGRPDLVGSKGFSAEDMAGMLYDSLHRKLLTLDDAVEVYPAHGAGSACGKNISKERSSTIGVQRKTNYALHPMPRPEFVKMLTTDLPPAPNYFSMDAAINRRGAGNIADIPIKPLSIDEVEHSRQHGALVLDVRDAASFAAGHIPRSINIGLRGSYASWSGNLIDPAIPLILIAEQREHIDEAVLRLARVGIESVAGYLEGGIAAWAARGLPVESTTRISVEVLHERMKSSSELQVIDVRGRGEFAVGHVAGARNVPLPELEIQMNDVATPTAVICEGGYRSAAAASLLRRKGFAEVCDVIGGTNAWVKAGFEVES